MGNEIERALIEAKSRFIKIENIISRNLFHQQEKITDAKQIATEGWCEIDAALAALDSAGDAKAEPVAWRPIETCKTFGFERLFYSPGNPNAENENARAPYQEIDTLTPYSPGGGRSYPESPYTHWRPLPPNPAEES